MRASERERLKKMAYGHKSEYRLRMRTQVVLHAARGRSNARIVRETGLHLDTVRCWRDRFAGHDLAGLSNRERSGRPPSFTELQVAQVKALGCRLPAESGGPLARWLCPELAREVVARAITGFTVRRWLADDALKPWQYRSWIFITDPDFRIKAERVLDLYARIWQGIPLGEDEYVISADEKTSIQTRCRLPPHPRPRPGKSEHAHHIYGRVAAPWPTSPPTTSTPQKCSAAPSHAPASTRS
ncbi:helix-turn-helix domain-containing protein (plasmid) [Streptomyces sp. AHU1]|uniref:helix-turn-helix domain-containing protein n=1 Tax=Streptomyces sp. AHU1 TaxID=3377215 RepID=UPI003877A60F